MDKEAPRQKKMDSQKRKRRTQWQTWIMMAFVDGLRVQIFGANGSWLTCNADSGFGCGWNWTKSIYRIHPEDDRDGINELAKEFYDDPVIEHAIRAQKSANRFLDSKHFQTRYYRNQMERN